MIPNFLIVGAAKAGTTTVSSLLRHHPDIFISDLKEPRFFTTNWDRGLQWYRQLFEGAQDHAAVGEASVNYTSAPLESEVPRRIAQTLGDIKYVYLVRHPIERIVSHYKHAIVHRWIPKSTSFVEALEREPRIKHCSRYEYQLQQYDPYTEPDQWRIVPLERLIDTPQLVANELFDFLGGRFLDTVDLPHENSSGQKSPVPNFLPYLRSLKPYLPLSIIRLGRNITGMIIAASNQMRCPIPEPDISDDLYARLEAEFAPEVRGVNERCEYDLLSIWGFSGADEEQQ